MFLLKRRKKISLVGYSQEFAGFVAVVTFQTATTLRLWSAETRVVQQQWDLLLSTGIQAGILLYKAMKWPKKTIMR